MPTINVQADLSAEKLLEAAEQLDQPELDQLVSKLLTLRARQKAPNLSETETQLLLRINEGLPGTTRKRYWELIRKRQDESLTPGEYEELIRISDEVEEQQAQRLEALAQLAQIRDVHLRELMGKLGIKPYGDN